LSIGIAILRYRLWDVDILINRTLVYGALTACVVALYVLVVGYLGALFCVQGNLPISLVATGCVQSKGYIKARQSSARRSPRGSC
jgi:hypothetical protein